MEVTVNIPQSDEGLKISKSDTVSVTISNINLGNISMQRSDIQEGEFKYSLILSDIEKTNIKEEISKCSICSDMDVSNIVCYGETLKGTINETISIRKPTIKDNVLSSKSINLSTISSDSKISIRGSFTLDIIIIVRGKDEKRTGVGYTIVGMQVDNNSIRYMGDESFLNSLIQDESTFSFQLYNFMKIY